MSNATVTAFSDDKLNRLDYGKGVVGFIEKLAGDVGNPCGGIRHLVPGKGFY